MGSGSGAKRATAPPGDQHDLSKRFSSHGAQGARANDLRCHVSCYPASSTLAVSAGQAARIARCDRAIRQTRAIRVIGRVSASMCAPSPFPVADADRLDSARDLIYHIQQLESSIGMYSHWKKL